MSESGGLGFVLGARDIELIPGGMQSENHREVRAVVGREAQDTWEQARRLMQWDCPVGFPGEGDI